MKTVSLLALAAFVAGLGSAAQAQEKRRLFSRPTGVEKTFEHDGKERIYRIVVPERLDADKPAPLLVVFHGGGGNCKQSSRMGFTELAEREGIIVLYPEGEEGHWSDGRTDGVVAEKVAGNDDVGFVTTLIEKVGEDFKIDPDRIYATGFSNGGMMSHRMGIEKADLFAAIAPGIGGIPEEMATPEKFRPSEPVSVLIIQGTEDPFVPYDGGKVQPKLFPRLKAPSKDRGSIVSTEKALELWRSANGIRNTPTDVKLPDVDPDDECALVERRYPEGRNGSKLVLVQMVGAGHTILGGAQYLPENVIGKTCRDADAVEMIWKFFKEAKK